MKRKIKLSIAITVACFTLALSCQTPVYGLAPAPSPTPVIVRDKSATKQTLSPAGSKDEKRKIAPDLSAIKSNLPDLSVYFVYPPSHWDSELVLIRVAVRNVGNTSYQGPISVWLRAWKPVQGQPLTDEPKENTFVWGGVLTIPDGLEAGGMKEVRFITPNPPGGWSKSWANEITNPLYVRFNATVDPKNVIKESNEKNNSLVR